MRNIFTRLWVVSLLLLVTATVSAQLTSLEVGKVYRFVNARTAGRSLNGCGSGNVNTTTTDATDLKQQWYVTKDGDYYVLRNLYYAQYLKGASKLYEAWTMTDDYSATQNKFELVTSNSTLNTLKIKDYNDGYGYMHDSDNSGHYSGYSVVNWQNGNGDTGTHWTINEVTYSVEDLKAILDEHPTAAEVAARITNFHTFFTDDACTTPSYTTLELAKAAAEYSLLSADLQALVDEIYTKVLSDNWEEDNAVDGKDSWGSKYAKKFRVQMYEPYSIAGDITSWLGINAHANNDNPTGIYMPEAGTLYVMVEGTIKYGASLRIVDGGHNWRVTNATGGGYALKSGLNVINYTGTAGQLYICYNVDTYNPDGETTDEKFPRKLSEYPPLKIHIEGGAITGYYNACGDFRAADSGTEDLWKTITGASVDNDADWEYMETRANLNVIPLLAHRQILLFHLNDYTHEDGSVSRGMAYYLPDQLDVPATPYNSTKNWADYGMECDPSKGKINIMLEAWDRIMYSELATMGLVSQSTMAKMNAFYPRWKADGSQAEMYDFNGASVVDGETYQVFCNGLDYSEYFNHHGVALGTESGYMYGGWDHCGYSITTYNGIVQNMANNAGSTWGPAHEIGHQHQAPLTLNGLTEVTNNLFSNIALWYKGMSTSRYNGDNGSLESVLNAFNTEGSDIYTNNIWALTHLYYRLWLYYHLAGNNTQFYPRLFELLRQQPMQKGYNVSGDESTLHFYKLACQAAGEDLTEFFRAHGYFSIMDDRLVGDYSNSVYEVSQKMIDDAIAEVKEMGYEENLAIIFICDDDENAQYVQHDGTTERVIYGETTPDSDFGSVSDFINGNVSVETTYTATLNSDGTLTMSGGEGGVGFLVLNEDGEIVSFSNKYTFAISDEAAYLLATGKATVVAVDTDSNTTKAEVDVTAMRFALLQELIENAIALAQNTSETRVGFYKPSAVTNLSTYIEQAKNVIATADYESLQAVYELLYAEYNAVVANEFSRVVLVPGSKFAIISVKSNDRILTYSGSNVTTVSGNADVYSSTDAYAYQWYIERDGAYYIKNAGTSKYIQDVTDQNGVLYTVGDNKVNMNINEVALGCYTIATSNVPGRYMNMDGADAARIITWGDAYSENSQWAFILLDADDTNAAKEELLELSKKTLALVNEVATISYNEGSKISLQSSSSTTANYIWSNAAVSGNDVDKLLDSDINTFFHSQWNNSTAPDDGWGHHISVDLGTSSTLTSFKFNFTTRNASNLSNYPKTIEVYGSDDNSTYTKLQVASGFATGAGVNNEALVMGNGTAYRYLRFLVTDATGNNAGTNTGSDGMVFFHMAEFSLYPITVSAEIKSEYTNSTITTDDVLAAYIDAEQGKTVYNNTNATPDDINAKKTALGDGTTEGSYTTLLSKYDTFVESGIEDKKQQLQDLINQTNELLATVGSVGYVDEVLELTTENLYCNDYHIGNGDDDSENYVEKLTDGDHTTYLHTDWNNTNSNGTTPHYLRVDMGEGVTITKFKFNYVTRKNGDNCPTGIVVEGSNDADNNYKEIVTYTEDANGLPVDYSEEGFESETIASVPYRYIRFRVSATDSGPLYFVMSEFGFTKIDLPVVTMINVDTSADEELVYNTYIATAKSQKLHDAATTSAELIDAAIADQQAVYNALDKAIKTAPNLDFTELEALVESADDLYKKVTADDGSVNDDYITSALTNEQLAAMATALASAKDMLTNALLQSDIETAKDNLQAAYDVVAAVEATNEKGSLDTTNDLNALIGSVNTLLVTISDAAASNLPLRLQTTANKDFYLSVSATGSGAIANLIDKNSDGSANIDSYFGTAWDGVAEYSQYVQVDLGDAVYIQQLLFDYTTRNDANKSSDFPSAIKVLGSNDGTNFTEVTSFTENLATTAGTKWAMAEAFEMPVHYRYLRFAAIGTGTNSFNMSDFNLYVQSDRTVKNYYATAAELDLAGLVQALQSAQYAMERGYITQAQYDAAYAMLYKHYQAATAVVNADKADRSTMSTLITNTTDLINEVAHVAEVVTPVWKDNIGNVYCNADNTGNTDAGESDKIGVSALFDGDVSTHLHTTYGNKAQLDDLDHYIRFDMGAGAAVQTFTFSYTGRESNSGNDPETMIIQGCDATDGTWVSIDTLTNLPTSGHKVQYCDTIEADAAYRYIRFMVTDTENHSYTTYNGIQHKFFVMSEFNFTALLTVLVRDGFYNVTSTMVRDAYNKKDSVQNIIPDTRYLSESDFTTAYNSLEAAYNNLLFYKTYVEKAELCNEMARLSALKEELYEITYNTTEAVSLQDDDPDAAGYLYCNAPGRHNSWGASDQAGVGALLDNDTNATNYLHTEYTNDAEGNDDGLDHYLRVDVGTATEYIEFKYKGRPSYGNQSPSTIEVWACNNLAADNWVKVKTFENLAETTGDEVAPGVVGNGIAYRYWRFMVTANHGAGNCNGHPYFALTAFEVNRYTNVEKTLKYSPNIYIYSTDELVTEITSAITTAQGIETSDEATQPQVDEQVAALQAEYDKLAEALLYPNIPVRITTDENAPVLYNINFKRGDNAFLKYLESNKMVSLQRESITDASYYAFYFMNSTDGVLIKPFNADGKVLGANDINNGDSKISAIEAGAEGYAYEWEFVAQADGYYNIKITKGDASNYMSDFGNYGKETGFYNSNNTSDAGSLFKFSEATFTNDNARYYQLSDVKPNMPSTDIIVGGTTVGAYKNSDAYSTAYSAASGLIDAGSNTSAADDCYAAYTALRAASADVEQILPEEGNIYRIYITPGYTANDRAGASMRIDDNAKLACGVYDAADAHYYFTFEYDDDGNLYMKNLHSATYLDEALNSADNENVQVGADAEDIANAKKIAINTLGKSGEAVVVGIVPDGGDMLNCAGKPGNVVAYNNTDVAKASAWVIEEVEPTTLEENVKHTVTLGNNTVGDDQTTAYSSLCLGYPVTLPVDADVVAYTITAEPDLESVVTLTSIAGPGETIPANTPVILKGTTNNSTICTLSFAVPTDAVATVDAATNLLGGTTYAKYLSCFEGDENVYNIYMLTRKNGLMAMRWVYENYQLNDDGTYSKVANANSNDGGYVLCPANKAYLKLGGIGASLSAEYFFSFFDTTDIDTVESEKNPLDGTIYDLQGRKIDEVTTAGFYIVNGEKVYVNPEMLK